MYHKVRITVVSLVVMAICVLSSVGTLSYFTDTDSATNDFVVGNASTELKVYDDVTSGSEYEMVASDYTVVSNHAYKDGNELNEIPFYLRATNDGNIPVYQRFRVVIPIALASEITLDLPTMDNNCVVETADNHTCSNNDYTVIYNPSVVVENNPTYAEYYIISNNILAVEGTTVDWPIIAIKIGNISEHQSELTCATDSNNCVIGVRVYSDAIQTAGFTDAVTAFVGAGETY